MTAKKSSNAKHVKKTKKAAAQAPTAPAVISAKGLVDKQPQSKQQAADSHEMFLYTDDAWSLRYFDKNDLHCKEREVFG